MSHTRFTLGLFASFGPPSWQAADDRLNGGDWWNGDFFADLAQQLEAARVDFLFFEDTATVSTAIGGTMDADLKHTIYSPKHDPLALLSYLAARTRHLGLIATASTTFYPPWLLARLLSTIDGLSNGRVGWNIVTSSDTTAAQNFGMTDLPPHAERYARAEEFVEVTKQLWDAWEEGALLRDLDTNTYVDPAKVHHIDHDGHFYSVRGPLNTLRPPQGRPLLVQAGSSPRGRDFAAAHADVVFAPAEGGVAGMKAFRDDIRERAARFGRDPDEVKVVFAAFVRFTPPGVNPDVQAPLTDAQLEYALAFLSATLDTDLSQFPLDEPFPADLSPAGHTGMFEELQRLGQQGQSLREAVGTMRTGSGTAFAGTPQRVAEKLIDAMDAIGGDGVMVIGSNALTRSFIEDLTQGLVPALRAAGVIRQEYDGLPLRESLRAVTETTTA